MCEYNADSQKQSKMCGKGFAFARLQFFEISERFFGFRRAGRVREGGTAGFWFLAGARNSKYKNYNSKLSRAWNVTYLYFRDYRA